MLYPAELRDLIEEFHCFFERSYLIVQIYTSVRKEYIDILTIFVDSVLIAHPESTRRSVVIGVLVSILSPRVSIKRS